MDSQRSINNSSNNNIFPEQLSTLSTQSKGFKKLRRLDTYINLRREQLGLDTPMIEYGKQYEKSFRRKTRSKTVKINKNKNNQKPTKQNSINSTEKNKIKRSVKFDDEKELEMFKKLNEAKSGEVDISFEESSVENSVDKEKLNNINKLSDKEKNKIILNNESKNEKKLNIKVIKNFKI